MPAVAVFSDLATNVDLIKLTYYSCCVRSSAMMFVTISFVASDRTLNNVDVA